MRRVLKRLRKGIKSACLAAALVTCWSVGQPAQVSAATVELRFSGTVSPAVNDVSHLYLIYGTNWSGDLWDLGSTKLGDFSAGQTTAFSVLGDFEDIQRIYWSTAGLYGDISGGQYAEGLNGVTLGMNISAGNSWAYYSHSVNEGTVVNPLLHGTIENVHPDWWDVGSWYRDYCYGSEELEFSETINLFDFSSASSNGSLYVGAEEVPEPISIILFAAAGMLALPRRRPKK